MARTECKRRNGVRVAAARQKIRFHAHMLVSQRVAQHFRVFLRNHPVGHTVEQQCGWRTIAHEANGLPVRHRVGICENGVQYF